MGIKLRKFQSVDNDEYAAWFEDDQLHRLLGPPWTEEELAEVLRASDHSEWAAFEKEELVAVVGVYEAIEENPAYVISDIAVKPTLRGRGIGGHVIVLLIAKYNLRPGELWRAFIHEKYLGARKFIESLGWRSTFSRFAYSNLEGFTNIRFRPGCY